jgi:hypothetical protein
MPARLPGPRLKIETEEVVKKAPIPVVAVIKPVVHRAVTIVAAVDKPQALTTAAPPEPVNGRVRLADTDKERGRQYPTDYGRAA